MFRLSQTWKARKPVRLLVAGVLAASLSRTGVGCGGAGTNEGDGNDQTDTSPPSAPSGLEGNSEESAVTLNWNGPSANDLAGYNVYRDTNSINGISDRGALNETLLSDPLYTDKGAKNGTTYYYVVTAVDKDTNESAPSNEIEKTPFDDPPDRP
jgi:hypothetical protein